VGLWERPGGCFFPDVISFTFCHFVLLSIWSADVMSRERATIHDYEYQIFPVKMTEQEIRRNLSPYVII
jgi:hypothetical protein